MKETCLPTLFTFTWSNQSSVFSQQFFNSAEWFAFLVISFTPIYFSITRDDQVETYAMHITINLSNLLRTNSFICLSMSTLTIDRLGFVQSEFYFSGQCLSCVVNPLGIVVEFNYAVRCHSNRCARWWLTSLVCGELCLKILTTTMDDMYLENSSRSREISRCTERRLWVLRSYAALWWIVLSREAGVGGA